MYLEIKCDEEGYKLVASLVDLSLKQEGWNNLDAANYIRDRMIKVEIDTDQVNNDVRSGNGD